MKAKSRTFSPFRTQRINMRTGKVLDTVDIDLAADLRIGKDLQRQLRESMTKYGWYAQLKEMAHAKMKQCKFEMHSCAEEIYDEVRVLNPRMSETQVKNKVHLSPRWRKTTQGYMRWRDRHSMLSEICRTLWARNENLRTLEATERREREGKY